MTSQNTVNSPYYEPSFTYHGFRFVELTGYPATPSQDTITACHLHTSVPNAGSISFNPHILNQLQSNIIWGQQSNLMSVPTDCDQRDERLGWTADGHVRFCCFSTEKL
jgi:alpha-L-rhamnosidase